MKKALFAMTLLLLVAALAVAEDISGKWEMKMESPRGERVQEITIAQDGENITVTSVTRRGDTVESKGTFKDGKISWSSTRETPRGEFTMTYTGELKEGVLAGTVDFGGRGQMPWTATKMK
jgi:hypothetical protein